MTVKSFCVMGLMLWVLSSCQPEHMASADSGQAPGQAVAAAAVMDSSHAGRLRFWQQYPHVFQDQQTRSALCVSVSTPDLHLLTGDTVVTLELRQRTNIESNLQFEVVDGDHVVGDLQFAPEFEEDSSCYLYLQDPRWLKLLSPFQEGTLTAVRTAANLH